MCVCVSSYLLRGIDDSGVVAELQGANHSRADAHHQRERYLLQDNRETGSAVSGDTGSTVRHDECKGYGDSLAINPGRRSFMGIPPQPRHMYPFPEEKLFLGTDPSVPAYPRKIKNKVKM